MFCREVAIWLLSCTGNPHHASALAILAVHATIAYTDALCIHWGGRKSTSADHTAVVRLLKAVLGTVTRTLAEKDRFEYQGYVAKLSEAQRLFDRAERYAAWAENMIVSG